MSTGDDDFHVNAAAIDRVTDRLVSEGRYVEAGWQSLRMTSVPPDAGEVQLRSMRACFFAGAYHTLKGVEMWSLLSAEGEEGRVEARRLYAATQTELEGYTAEVFHAAEQERRRG